MNTTKWVSMYHWPIATYAVQDMPDIKWTMHDTHPMPSAFQENPHLLPIHDTYLYHPWTSITHSALGQNVVNTGNNIGIHSHLPVYPYGGFYGNEWNAIKKEKNVSSGPIPANPLRIHKDSKGVDWISFAYSRERVRTEYTIRGDVETVDLDTLSEEFKQQNCIYPRARVPPEQYTGTRHRYETECNSIGWALAKLNPCLRNKRGLIQRAVDSWRNKEPSLRSRRVRRMAALNNFHSIQEARHVLHPSNQESPLPPQFRQVTSTIANRVAPETLEEKGKPLNTEVKKPKYILLDDLRKKTRVRIRVGLDEINLEEIPDAFRRDHCVFPRRFIPMHTSTGEPINTYEQEFQTEEAKKEQMLNEIGWKLAWLNVRLFENRPTFLQRAVDAYRNKIEIVTCEEKWGTRKGRKAWFNKTCS
ncbi:hypothetical protein MERGE_001137 [Pneumocystis wakefieldiae]|uniref:DUF8032 domain-containing protein n=1 Tax=Pneumocystis wakefieldiae TaxID=38082 RepID=A0A899FY77_9ASCO|nr:hypothetical protein MERGE_001137 [Pneumocystis wakefieldiae]